MNKLVFMRKRITFPNRQRGVVLFIALIALVTIMLAAVALVRSVDTSSLVAGNIAFRRAATSSGDGGLESAITWLAAQSVADVATLPAERGLNITNGLQGYDANLVNFIIASPDSWTDQLSASAGRDTGGNDVRYRIERMCSASEGIEPVKENCVFSDAESQTDSMATGGQRVEKSGASVMYRVTTRVTGPRNTVSYIQAFIY